MADRKFNIDEVIVNDRSAGEFFFEQKELVVSTVLASCLRCEASITFSPDGKLINYMESVRTMWIKWGYGRGTEKEYNRGIEFAKWIHYLMTNNLLKKQR